MEDVALEEDLFNMSDEDLENAFKSAKADEDSPEIDDITKPEEEEPEEVSDEDEVEEDEDEEESDLEQPADEEESDDNSEDGEDEEESEEDSEEDELADESEAEDPVEEEAEPEAEAQATQKRLYKANGQEFEFTDDEVKDQFGKVFGQAMNYTKKMQAIKPYTKMISAMQEEKLTEDDMNLMIDVLKGDKNAMSSVLERTGVDALDLNTEDTSSYQPNSYGRNETELAIKDIVDEIGSEPEWTNTQNVIENQWDDNSRDAFVKNPQLIKELHVDMRNGVYEKVSPMATKLKVLDGGRKSDLDYYVEAGQQYWGAQNAEAQRQKDIASLEAEKAAVVAERARLEKVKQEGVKRKAVKKASVKRKAAAPTTSRAGNGKSKNYLEDSDEGFEEWYKALEDKM
jgi:hypothetical protein